jgi:DNA polymerase-3 subunit gamma/tau
MAVLYRKYRPQTFSEVLGQKHIVKTLQNQVAAGAPAHAFLFCGSRGIGKTSVARILAKAVNCLSRSEYNELHPNDPKGDACGECNICKQIEQGTFLDLIEVDAASNTGVDNVRDLIEHIKFSPSIGKYKVFIIDEVHMLSKGAFNALLKTLEEPPFHAIFILATTEVGKVPATIVSRTQRFDFRRLSTEELKAQMEKILKAEKLFLDPGIVELVAQNAEGSVRDALSLLDKVLTLGEAAAMEDCQALLGITDLAVSEKLFRLIAGGKTGELPDFFQQLLEKGTDLTVLNRDFLEYLRKALVWKITESGAAIALDNEALARLKNLVLPLTAVELIFFSKLFLKSYKDLSGAPSPEMPLLIASLEAAFKKSGSSDNQNTDRQSLKNLIVDDKPVTSPSSTLSSEPKGPPSPISPFVETSPSAKASEDKSEDRSEREQGEVARLEESSVVQIISSPEVPAIDLEEIKRLWPEVVVKIKAVNTPLANVIKNSLIHNAFGNVVVMGVKFLFHKQSLESPKNQGLIAEVLQAVFHQPLRLRAEVIKSAAAPTADASQGLDDVLKVFGGELID